nr:MAG TPA: Putative hydrogenase expression/formation protein [Inoviridae sp.]
MTTLSVRLQYSQHKLTCILLYGKICFTCICKKVIEAFRRAAMMTL